MSIANSAGAQLRQPQRPLALIADKDAAIRELLLELFREAGWEARIVALPLSPEEVMQLRPQLLLVELCQSVPAEALHYAAALSYVCQPHGTRVLLTSTDHILLADLAQHAASDSVRLLAKPFGYDDLLSQLHSLAPGGSHEDGIEQALGA